MAEATRQTYFTETPLERVHRIRDTIAEGGDEAQKVRRLPSETADVLIQEGLYRFTLPHELGGENASVRETIDVLEAIAAIDGSVGWNVMIGSEINAIAAGGMDPAIAREVYLDNPRVIMCGGGGPGTQPSYAIAQKDGSYRVWGQATFLSGCHNAEWAFMVAPIVEDGNPKMDDAGNPIFRMWFLHRSEWEIKDTWHMAGLRGSGSHDVFADGALVPERLVPVELFSVPAHYPNPVFRIPVALRLSFNKAAVAIGVARGALDAFSDIAQNKIPLLTTSALKDKPIAHYRMGEGEATLRAARAFLMETMDDVVEELEAGAPTPAPKPPSSPAWPAPMRRTYPCMSSTACTTPPAPPACAWTARWNGNSAMPTVALRTAGSHTPCMPNSARCSSGTRACRSFPAKAMPSPDSKL